jgi:hypothetical protein
VVDRQGVPADQQGRQPNQPANHNQFLQGLDADWKSGATTTSLFLIHSIAYSSGSRPKAIDIVKPEGRGALVYKTLANTLTQYALTQQPAAPNEKVVAAQSQEQQLLQQLMDDLCDRGVLKNPASWELPGPVYRSLEQIHDNLRDVLRALAVGSAARRPVQDMQAAALAALQNSILFPNGPNALPRPVSNAMFEEIQRIRAVFSAATDQIAVNSHLVGNCSIRPEPSPTATSRSDRFIRFYEEYPTATPDALVCADRPVPRGSAVVVSLAGSWSEMKDGKCTSLDRCRQGPVVWPPRIIGKTATSDGNRVYDKLYVHPTTILPRPVDYTVCVQLPITVPGASFIMTSGDSLKMSVIDGRDAEDARQ